MPTDTILTPQMITREALMILENNLTFAKQTDRQYSDQFAKSGAKIGATLNIRKPVRYTVSSGPALDVQDYTETQVPLVVNKQKHVDISFSSIDLTLSLQDFSERVLAPAVARLANEIDSDGLALYSQIYNSVGTPGTVPATSNVYLNAGALLTKNAAPSDRAVVINPDMMAVIVPALQGLLSPTDEIGKQYKTGQMGKALGLKFNEDANVGYNTVGPLGGTPLVSGTPVGASLTTKGWTAAAALRLNVGNVFTIDGVYATNPQNQGVTAGYLQQFTVTAAFSSIADGTGTISISPAIVTSGAFQNVVAGPANNAAITVVGAANTVSAQGLAFTKEAFTLATVDLEDVSKVGAWGARVSDKQLGVSMRIAKQYIIGSDTVPCRIDILYGWAVLRPELAVRIQS